MGGLKAGLALSAGGGLILSVLAANCGGDVSAILSKKGKEGPASVIEWCYSTGLANFFVEA
jgi:hypothetical protein